MKRIKILIAALLLLFTVPAQAQFALTESGAEFEATYTEPSLNAANPDTGEVKALEDLSHTTIYFQKDFETTPTIALVVPATSLFGGGEINEKISIPITPFSEFEVDVWATATDTASPLPNQGGKSNIVKKRIDNWAPGPPG